MTTPPAPATARTPSIAHPIAARWAALWAAVLVFITCGYFQNSRPGWNVNSQFALTCALAERGTFRIDAYHENANFETGDKAFYGGHYYSDKSPVTAMLGVPAFFLYRTFSPDFSYAGARAWTTWWTIGLAAAILAGLTAVFLMRRGVAPGRAAWAAALWVAATPLMGYAILYFNYLPACAMALGGFVLIERVWREPGWNCRWRLALGGLLLGLATWTLNTMALAALALTVALMLAPAGAGGRWRVRWGRLWPWALGGLAGVAGHFVYTRAVFGAFTTPYAYEVDPFFREQMARGLMGATRPRWLVAWLITVHPFQGLFLWFPITAMALAGTFWFYKQSGWAGRIEAEVAIWIFIGLLVYNSAYFMWWGGWAYAPRHLIPALAFLPLGLVPWLAGSKRSDAAERRGRSCGTLSEFEDSGAVTQGIRAERHGYPGLCCVSPSEKEDIGVSRVNGNGIAKGRCWMACLLFWVGAGGAVLNLAAVALNPQHPPGLPQEALLRPESVAHWPIPMLELQKYFWIGGQTDHNWGTALGLQGPVSLLPLVLIWVAGWLLARRRLGRKS